jgi:Tol biopolymer transport system component
MGHGNAILRRLGAAVLGSALAGSVHAAFPGANGKLAFESDRTSDVEVWTTNADGSDPQVLASFFGAADRNPAWSPDGTKVAFQSNRTGDLEIWVANADGTGALNLTQRTGSDLHPAWSPDGTKIAWARWMPADFAFDIWVMNADGTGARNVSAHWANDVHPAWSPDGATIAFESDRDFDLEIYTQPAASSGGDAATNRTRRADSDDMDPSYAPDGATIAFVSTRGDSATRIYTMFADGSVPTLLPGSVAGDDAPAFSPDGRKVAFSRVDGNGRRQIVVADLVAESESMLTSQGNTNTNPDWQTIAAQEENHPPVAVAGPDGEAPCADASGAVVSLDGTASSDPDSTAGTNDDIVVYEWFLAYGTADELLLGTGARIDATLPVGTSVVTLRVTDAGGLQAADEAVWTVVDPAPPSIAVSVSPNSLWPPNHKMVDVRARVVVTGGTCSPAPAYVLQAVESSEPDDADGEGDGNTVQDVQGVSSGTPDLAFALRAERDGNGPGRVYTVTYAIADGPAAGTTAVAVVTVAHDAPGAGDATSRMSRPAAAAPDRGLRAR